MSETIVKVKVLQLQTDIILQKVLQKYCGMTHNLKLSQIHSGKIRNGQLIDEVIIQKTKKLFLYSFSSLKLERLLIVLSPTTKRLTY